jgi:quercetin dioxygenase-like cupin family protein
MAHKFDHLQVQTNDMAWEKIVVPEAEEVIYRKVLVRDPETGISATIVRYDAGMVTPWHQHNCAHGLFVLEGTLRTHSGEFKPGSFVWFPEGSIAEHGATQTEPVEVLLFTNKAFNIHFLDAEEREALGCAPSVHANR